ncbi:orotate phosphoribosyltransferase [Roseburia hominis]
MDARLVDLRSTKNPKARIKIMQGHFATSHSHINTYIDMSTVKVRHNNCRETAKVLAGEYVNNTMIDTIVCLEETDTIGTFMAEQLADVNQYSLSKGNNISLVTPEYHQSGQILFRDNKQRMIKNMQVLILAASITTGKSVKQAIESILYYGGSVCGICSIFSSINKIHGIEVKTIFTSADLPNYRAYPPGDCPMCKEGKRLEAIVNSFGYSKI